MASKEPFDYRELDDLIHSRPRLGIMSVLVALGEVDFRFLKERLQMTDGNLGTHLRKLEEAGYIAVRKGFVNRRPRTSYVLTDQGRRAFEAYLERLEGFLQSVERRASG